MKFLTLSLLCLQTLAPGATYGATWWTDLSKAKAQAKLENRIVLINFTGSDWCGWCIRLKREVFLKREFDEYATNNLVLVEIDFPKHKTQAPALRQANRALAEEFCVEGFPTLVVLNADGEKLGVLGFAEGGPKSFIKELEKITRKPADTVPAKEASSHKRLAGPPPRAVTGIQADNSGLTLKGISGPKAKRLALINNQTFSVGESATVSVLDGEVKVRCLEIRAKSVIVTLNGRKEPLELKLSRRL